MFLIKFEAMLKTNNIYFFDLDEFKEIAIHYIDFGKHALARKAIKLGLEQHPHSIDLRFFRVELSIFENKDDEALLYLEEIEQLEPDNEEVFTKKAAINSKFGNHKEAILILKKALIITDDKPYIWALIGMQYMRMEDYEKALSYFTNSMELDTVDYLAIYNIVFCYDVQKEHAKAITFLNNYLNKNPYCEIAWHQLGRQFFILNDFKKALNAFDYAILVDESFIGGYLEKAKTLEVLGEYQDAIDNYLITLDLDDPTAFALLRIGVCFEKLHNYNAAISYYKKAVHEDPLLEKGFMLLANIYFDDKNYHKAAYYIAEALQIDEDNASYWKRYSEIKIKLNFYEEAVSGLEKCLMLGDKTIDNYIALVDVLSFLGEFNKAISVLYNAQKTFKNFEEIEYRLAGLFFILDKKNYGFNHLITGLNLDYEYHTILKEIYPTVFEDKNVQNIIMALKKS